MQKNRNVKPHANKKYVQPNHSLKSAPAEASSAKFFAKARPWRDRVPIWILPCRRSESGRNSFSRRVAFLSKLPHLLRSHIPQLQAALAHQDDKQKIHGKLQSQLSGSTVLNLCEVFSCFEGQKNSSQIVSQKGVVSVQHACTILYSFSRSPWPSRHSGHLA